MSNIDVTGIIETNPVQGQPTTESVRDNFAAIKTQLGTAKTELGNLSGVTDQATARSNIGVVIGTDVQAQDTTLQSLSALGSAADKMAYTTNVDTWAETALTAFARTVLDDADAATARATLGAQAADDTLQSLSALGTAADKIAYTTDVDTWAETPLTAFIRTLLDDANAAAAQTTLSVPSRTNLQTWIDGLKLEWASGTSLIINSGSAYIPSLGRIYDVPSGIPLTGLGFSANTWYHVYLYDNSGTPGIELSTTAPADPYAGTARTKTGDTSRRYLGSVLSNGDGTPIMYNFLHANGFIKYRNQQSASPFRLVSAGTATTETTVSAASVVPVTSRIADLLFINTADKDAYTGTSDDSASGPPVGGIVQIVKSLQAYALHPLNSSQAFTYWMASTPGSGGVYIDVMGYLLER